MWMTKGDPQRKGHFVVDGATLCARVVDKNGTRLAAFKTPFVEFDPWSHLCSMCSRLEAAARGGLPRRCTCGRCRIVPTRAAE